MHLYTFDFVKRFTVLYIYTPLQNYFEKKYRGVQSEV